MKQINKFFSTWCAKMFMLMAILPATVAMAQEETKKVDVNISTGNDGGGGAWYGQWWVWAIGLAVFIIIIVAITRGGSNKASS
jgi:hypothetical protein